MFDASGKHMVKTSNSELMCKEKGEDMNKNILNMISCPTILTGMSHEMRTYMNSIVAFSFLMNNTGCNKEEKQEFSNNILASCEQLMILFDNFLDSAIIDTGNSKTDLKKCQIGNVLDNLLSEFRVILKREDYKDIVLILENQFSNQTDVYLDSNRVARVIRSLFQNALSQTKSGYIKIGYYFSDGNIVFYILDSGHGYLKCKEFLETKNLNDSLSRHNDTSYAINLTLTRKLITLMSGNIWIESNGLSGTGMYFSVPVREAENEQDVSVKKHNNTRIAI